VKTVNENLEAELVEANDDFVICRGAESLKKIEGRNCSKKTLHYMEISKEAIVTVTFN
jgi:hypothetical protein